MRKWLFAVLLLPLFTATAHAATVDLSPIVDPALQLLGVLAAAVGTWAINELRIFIKRKTGIEIDNATRGYLDAALHKGIARAETLMAERLEGRAKVDVDNEVAASAAAYAVRTVPDALRHFGITEERLLEMVMARLGERGAAAAPAPPSK